MQIAGGGQKVARLSPYLNDNGGNVTLEWRTRLI